MVTLLLYIIIAITAFLSTMQPWVGIAACYLLIILNPQTIWWWHFDSIRPVLYIILPTVIGVLISILKGIVNFDYLNNKKNFWIFVLWLCFIISYFFGPYVNIKSAMRPFDPSWLITVINNIFILYFLACICIDDTKKIKILSLIVVFSSIYLIYWINDQYLFQGRYGRIGGPSQPGGGAIYRDENAFAMFFVTTLPFLYYLGQSCQNKLIRYGMWLVVPFGWHAIFLTGSRGGLVGLGVTLLVISVRSKNKFIAVALVVAALAAYHWQAGSVMKERTQTIVEYREERSAASRLEAWSAAIEMMKSHPFTGVGITSFIPAFPYYSEYRGREAHNTFFQIGAETGVIGAVAYIMIVFFTSKTLLQNSSDLSTLKASGLLAEEHSVLYFINEAVFTSFIGMVICSFFLSLHVYEIFYFLCLMANAIHGCIYYKLIK